MTGTGTGIPATAPAGINRYGTVTLLRQMLPQVPASIDTDTLLSVLLDRATAIVDGYLDFAFAAYGVAGTAKDMRSTVTGDTWDLPYHSIGSVSAIYVLSGKGTTGEDATTAVTEYDELDDGRLYYLAGWSAGTWYRITAKWGFGAAPTDVVQVTLELAVNLWRGRDRGLWSDVIGAEGGGAIGYTRALTNQQRMVLDNVRRRYAQRGFA